MTTIPKKDEVKRTLASIDQELADVRANRNLIVIQIDANLSQIAEARRKLAQTKTRLDALLDERGSLMFSEVPDDISALDSEGSEK